VPGRSTSVGGLRCGAHGRHVPHLAAVVEDRYGCHPDATQRTSACVTRSEADTMRLQPLYRLSFTYPVGWEVEADAGKSSPSSCSMCCLISSRIGRTASMPWPAGSSSSQSS
jgi:hypothetical protein